MTPDQGASRAPQEGESLYSFEVELANIETVIIDNIFGIKFARFGFINEEGKWRRGRRLKIVTLSDQDVESYTDNDRQILTPESVEDGYQVVPLILTRISPVLFVGRYKITPEIFQNESGHKVLLKIDPRPMGFMVVKGFFTQEIGKELVKNNQSQDK